MNKTIFMILFVIVFLKSNDINQSIKKPINFPVNECLLSIPYAYDIGIDKSEGITFAPSIISNSKDNIYFFLNLTEDNATQKVLTDLKKSNSIPNIKKNQHLTIITFENQLTEYIIGKYFLVYSSDKNNPYSQKLISYCNDTYHEDLLIEDIENLHNNIFKWFPYSFFLKKDRVIKIQKKLEYIYEQSLQ